MNCYPQSAANPRLDAGTHRLFCRGNLRICQTPFIHLGSRGTPTAKKPQCFFEGE